MRIPFTPPMECLLVKKLPDGPEWVYELKLDGYRAQAIREADGVRLLSRNGKDLSKRFPRVVSDLTHALMPNTVVDGELVAMDADGRPSFQALQNAQSDTEVVFYAFDILIDNAKDVRTLPLRDRLSHLDTAFSSGGVALLCESFPGPASRFIAAVRQSGGEGVVAKHLERPYEAEGMRSGAWRKLRLNVGQEFVIGGYTPGGNGFDSVIVGYYEGEGLVYVARVRAGFVPASRHSLFPKLESRRVDRCPFVNLPQAGAGRWGEGLTAAKMTQCVWIKPELVAAFEFLEWTDAGHVRHIKFIALRNDKDPHKVVREEPSQ